MPAFNYKPQFAPLIQNHSKFHTMRALRKHPAHQGDMLYHYTGMRNNKGLPATKIIEPTPCTKVVTMLFDKNNKVTLIDEILTPQFVNAYTNKDNLYFDIALQMYQSRQLTQEETWLLAAQDGFIIDGQPIGPDNFKLMWRFFLLSHKPPFFLNLYCWHPQPQYITYLNV